MRSYEVSILNQKFVIKSDADERYVQKVADYVGKKMHDIMSNTQSVSSLRVAMLVALNVADDLFKLKENKKNKTAEVEKKIKDMMTLIEARIS
ncbi:MAG: cell division protein ZapA [Deltaproteobacteria bacterium]|nr:cell division protein ZapA [Deltaproteobacteria bacterium]